MGDKLTPAQQVIVDDMKRTGRSINVTQGISGGGRNGYHLFPVYYLDGGHLNSKVVTNLIEKGYLKRAERYSIWAQNYELELRLE